MNCEARGRNVEGRGGGRGEEMDMSPGGREAIAPLPKIGELNVLRPVPELKHSGF